MNIHFQNKELFNQLMSKKIFKIKVGSYLYNLNDDESDTDIMIIYSPFKNQLYSSFSNHHQLQFKENNIDYLFIDLITFIKNIINSDSSINFEILNSYLLSNSMDLSFLFNHRFDFYSYGIIRCYVGMAERDCKHLFIKHKNELTDRYLNKKLSHIVRGYNSAIDIYKSIKMNMILYSNTKHTEFLKTLKTIDSDLIRKELRNEYKNKLSEFRIIMNNDYNSLPKFMSIENQSKIDNYVYELLNSRKYKNNDVLDMSLFYDSNENGIKY
jgi:hypothetical protein